MAVFLNLRTISVCLDNLLNVLLAEFVLGLDLLELLAGIDEEDVVIVLAALLHYQDTGRDACAVKDVGRQTDDCVNVVLLLNEELTDFALGCSAEQNAVRCNTSHCAAVIEVVDHVQDEGVVGF